jgi:hypothetical protein
METQEEDMCVPTHLIPHCPRCGKEMDLNLFWDDTFVRDEGWHTAYNRYTQYLKENSSGKVLYLELGVGFNSPGVIKVPFWDMAIQNTQAVFASVNLTAPCYPIEHEGRSIVISSDIDTVITDLFMQK